MKGNFFRDYFTILTWLHCGLQKSSKDKGMKLFVCLSYHHLNGVRKLFFSYSNFCLEFFEKCTGVLEIVWTYISPENPFSFPPLFFCLHAKHFCMVCSCKMFSANKTGNKCIFSVLAKALLVKRSDLNMFVCLLQGYVFFVTCLTN